MASTIRLWDLAPSPGACPYAQRARITLKEKGVPYDLTLIEKANKPQDFLDLSRSITSNPKHIGTVPVIIDGDVKLTESEVVAEYLDAKYPGIKLFPTDPYKLALVRLFLNNYNTLVSPSAMKIATSTTLEENKTAIAGLIDGLKILNDFLTTYGSNDGPFLGDDFSYAEVATLPMIYRYSRILDEARSVSISNILKENNLSRLQTWLEAGMKRQSIVDSQPADETIPLMTAMFVKVPLKDLK